MTRGYHVANRGDSRKLAELLSREGQLLLPMLDLITQAEMAVDELVDVAGRATIEAILLMSAQEVAGPKHPGKASGDIRWHGRQKGVVNLAERKLRVEKPRLRRKGQGRGAEAEIPAYEAVRMQSRLGERVLEILMRGVSTRNCSSVLPEMGETFTVNEIGLPGKRRRRLCTTNLIESPQSDVRMRTRRVSRWRRVRGSRAVTDLQL